MLGKPRTQHMYCNFIFFLEEIIQVMNIDIKLKHLNYQIRRSLAIISLN
jgi:hypothetical protein